MFSGTISVSVDFRASLVFSKFKNSLSPASNFLVYLIALSGQLFTHCCDANIPKIEQEENMTL